MRSRLRPQVLAPAAVLALAVLGLGAFVYAGGQSSDEPATPPAVQPAPAAVEPAPPPKKTPLQKALRKHDVVVVVLYAPDSAVDNLATREARAGALAVGAGFLAVDVSNEAAVSSLAEAFDVREAPALLVFKRGPEVVTRIDGFADRDTVAQAAGTAQL